MLGKSALLDSYDWNEADRYDDEYYHEDDYEEEYDEYDED